MSFVLLGTEGCHLCEVAAGLIVSVAQGGAYDVYQEDIADSVEGVERYGTRIPVLRNERNGAELDWPFGPDEVHRFITEGTEGTSDQ